MSSPEKKSWHFLTSHTQVLLCIQRNPEARLRDIADAVGITERAAQRIVTDLVDAGYVTRRRVGRRNQYTIERNAPMRHRAQLDHEIGELLDLLASSRTAEAEEGSAGHRQNRR